MSVWTVGVCGLWGQKDATPGETCAGADFQQAAYELLYECVGSMRKVLKHKKAKTRNVISHGSMERPLVLTITPRNSRWTITPRNSCVAARCLGLKTTGGDISSYHQLPFSSGTNCAGDIVGG